MEGRETTAANSLSIWSGSPNAENNKMPQCCQRYPIPFRYNNIVYPIRKKQRITSQGRVFAPRCFEDSQFESNRADGRRKLKPNAIPTIFDVPNPPKLLECQRIKGIGMPKDKDSDALNKRIRELEAMCAASNMGALKAKQPYETLRDKLKKKLSKNQVDNLLKENSSRPSWEDAALVKGLKLRFSLSKHGYNYLLQIGYPAPSYSTLNKRKGIEVPFEILWDFIELMKVKGGWKHLNTGVILCTTVIIQLSENCLNRGYDFLTGRTTQDALENVFSQIRRKAGSKPTALQSSKALKMICVLQYLSDIKISNYSNDTDRHLLTFSKFITAKFLTVKDRNLSLRCP
ncbi:hypothetical protein JTE90_024772 [Oedothorax gibbosus]|uniref:Transposable element P transposase n=1 Tax=Oedothorax gibbosus TaxID=931172 RepID=A0AAV6UBY8_9ARAC|nr:hypothetical protein JTE90_024772 [Oedothorax gibbosus]